MLNETVKLSIEQIIPGAVLTSLSRTVREDLLHDGLTKRAEQGAVAHAVDVEGSERTLSVRIIVVCLP